MPYFRIFLVGVFWRNVYGISQNTFQNKENLSGMEENPPSIWFVAIFCWSCGLQRQKTAKTSTQKWTKECFGHWIHVVPLSLLEVVVIYLLMISSRFFIVDVAWRLVSAHLSFNLLSSWIRGMDDRSPRTMVREESQTHATRAAVQLSRFRPMLLLLRTGKI